MINEIFEVFAAELRQQYAIVYQPSNTQLNGKWRRIKVKVKLPDAMQRKIDKVYINHRDGYFASPN